MDGEGKLKNWIIVAHPWAFPASATPALIAISYVFYLYKRGEIAELNWTYGILAFFGAVIIYATLYYKFKYVALGDLLIFICYGLSSALGVAYVMTGQLLWPVLLVIAPVGLLIVAILHASNTRNMLQGKVAGIRTQSLSLRLEGSQISYQTMLLVAYLLIAIMVMIQMLSNWTFLVLLSFPLASKNIKLMKKATMDDLGIIHFLDAHTAQLVLVFSLLLVVGNVIASFT